jgi:hypothetical protein
MPLINRKYFLTVSGKIVRKLALYEWQSRIAAYRIILPVEVTSWI